MNSTVYHISYSETSRRFYIALHWSMNLLDVASLQQFFLTVSQVLAIDVT